MSHKATNWAVERRGISPIAKVLLWHLADRHNPDNGCFPDQATLARDTELSRSSINRHLTELEIAGLVQRVQRTDPLTGRQLSTRYLLAFEEGFTPQDVVVRVSDSDTDRVSESDDAESQDGAARSVTADTPITSNLTSNRTEAPQPPLAGGLGFASLWEKWPLAARGSRENAEGAFNRLSADEQASAIRAAETTISVLTVRKQRIPSLKSYLSARMFVEYDGAPPVDIDGDFVIKPGWPEWSAWLGAVRKEHGEDGVQRAIKPGFMIRKSRWPEGHVAHMPPLRAEP